jgi:hypothetical protein
MRVLKVKFFEDGYITDIIKVIKAFCYQMKEVMYYYKIRENSIMNDTKKILKMERCVRLLWENVELYRLLNIDKNTGTQIKYSHYSIGFLLMAINQHSYKHFKKYITHFKSYKYSILRIFKN